MLVLNSGGWNEGEGMITSVSNDGMTLLLDGPAPPNAEDRLDARAFLTARAPPAPPTLCKDFLGDLRGDRGAPVPVFDKGCTRACSSGATGVGGNSASTLSTCHERFSSISLRRSD